MISIPSRSLRKQIRAGISWRTYIVATHILTSCMYNNIQFLIWLQCQPICSVLPQDTFEDFFILPLCRIIHFFEPFLLYGSECVIVWFVTVHDENSPCFVYTGYPYERTETSCNIVRLVTPNSCASSSAVT